MTCIEIWQKQHASQHVLYVHRIAESNNPIQGRFRSAYTVDKTGPQKFNAATVPEC